MALQALNGKNIYDQELKINWAITTGQNQEDTAGQFHVFVGDLGPDIDDQALLSTFSRFGSCSSARVMWDATNGRSRGYGFIAFRKKEDAQRALTEMNGELLGNRSIRCNWASQKVTVPTETVTSSLDYSAVLKQSSASNCSVYIGNLTADISEPLLKTIFSEYGHIEEMKMHLDKAFAFIRFSTHESAGQAIVGTHGRVITSKPLKVSWGKERPATTPTPVMYTNPYQQPQYMYRPQYPPTSYQQYPQSAPVGYGYPQGQISGQYYPVDQSKYSQY